MTFDEYETEAERTMARAAGEQVSKELHLAVMALGLAGEAGEVADKVKKVLRDHGGVFSPEQREALKLELGDVLWYVAQLASELGFELEEIGAANLDKLASRSARNVIAGSGDNR